MATTYKIYAAGEQPKKYKAGDFILVSQNLFWSKVIKFGQAIRYRGKMKPYAHWNHAAIIVDEKGTLIEAVGRGVVYGHIDEYKDIEYYYVSSKLNDQSGEQSVSAAKSFLNDKYGWFTIASIAIDLLTGIKLQFTKKNTMICSAVVGMSLWAGGYVFDSNPYQMMPADLAAAFNVICDKGNH
jgi:hypothetical protein